ncbi:class I SAM-dependent methyltransferase [Azospirillum picis]|uniref:Ubiquinone/menaquinone biosynthesis C-methylase UbiE n=1 Tax=Azospirillum picis TaxID=488438 RepID=A0ABU0MGC1_9PROT|nr:class I SAM-dependent methyltransferase [Azospirillum picis]MBP2298466.1 ubiquinone/menaquinone biosynthesis C-methylase UbiE [Azospirillum picis]MDQ0532485.1 ubiquinone/menaquinone biosynthesis C-methylase UbiE [Azospirillum picis]
MTEKHHGIVVGHYGPRAASYVTSAVHSGGADLDQIDAALQGGAATRILDLGCGGGHVSYRAARHATEVVAVDLTPEMLEVVAQTAAERGLTNIATREAAAEALPFADGHFDVVLCRFSAHHWHGFEAGLREARRVLTPRGKAIFIDVVSPAPALLDTHLQVVETLRDPSHVRNYTTAEWTAALARAGFAVTSLTPRRLRMEFAVWTARTRTNDLHAEAIRSLQKSAAAEVKRHFEIEDDGSFLLDTITIEAEAA